MSGSLIKFESMPHESMSVDDPAVFHQLLRALRCSPERWTEVLRCAESTNSLSGCYGRLEERCKSLEGQCEVLMRLVRHVCCSANINFSKITIDEYSDDSQVNLEQIVTGLGGDYVNAFPVTPGKTIRMQHPSRPGWTPNQIRIDMNLAGGANNYLDFFVEFYLGPGDDLPGKKIGPTFRGNQFLNKDGGQIIVPFPKYKNDPIDVGSLERLAVEITNRSGGVNLESAQVVIVYDNNRFYEMCRTEVCKPGCKPDCNGSSCGR